MRFVIVVGQPLPKQSAATLTRWLTEVGFDLLDVETVAMFPDGEREPTNARVKAETARVLGELAARTEPITVIAIGRYAVKLDPDLWRGGIVRCNGHSGKLALPDKPGVNAIAMLDPYHYLSHVKTGNTRRAQEIEGGCKLILSRAKTMDAPVLLPTVTELSRVVVNGLVGLDTETVQSHDLLRRISKSPNARVDPRSSWLKMVGLSDGQLAWGTQPGRPTSFDSLTVNRPATWGVPEVEFGADAEPIAYNLPFDAVIVGDWRPRWHDPKMLAHLLGEKDTEMKSLALRWLGRPLMHYDEAGGTANEPSYCVADSMTHRDLFEEGMRRASPGIKSLYEDVERPMFRINARWTMEGVFVLDRVNAQALYDQKLEEIADLEREITRITRGVITNPDSLDQKASYVFGWDKASGKDRPTVDAKTLSEHLRKRGVAEILERAKLKKSASTYLGAWLEWPFEMLGCLWRGTGAWTGRPSVAALQLHNVPPELRHFLGPRPGKRLRSFDNSQLEIRVAAHISGDTNMIRILRGEMPGYDDPDSPTFADLHAFTTDRLSAAVGRPVSRTFGKIGNFSQLYGGSEGAIYSQAPRFGLTIDEVRPVAKEIANTIGALFVDFNRWKQKVMHLQRVPGLFGAVLIPPPHSDESYLERERINCSIQRGAVDIVKVQTAALEDAGFKTVHMIHDEVIVELDERDDTPDTIRQIASIMESAVELDVPLKVDNKLWGQKG